MIATYDVTIVLRGSLARWEHGRWSGKGCTQGLTAGASRAVRLA